MLKLKNALAQVGRTQTDLAHWLEVSSATVSLLLKYDAWPKRTARDDLRRRIGEFLRRAGGDEAMVATAFDRIGDPGPALQPPDSKMPPTPTKDQHMLLRKHTISRDARQHFKIARDPFTDEMTGESDVYLTDDIRYVRAAMRQTARHGGMLAVIAESGGGKSTLRQDMVEWINSNREPITVVEPYILGMEENESKGRPLRAIDITGAIIRSVARGATLRASHQERTAQMHDILRASAQVGRRHVITIEEAHRLSTPTIRHLKGFYELQEGFKKLLSIILIGQTELEWKLSEQNPEVREVVQRCEIVHLPPLDNHVEGYLRHKLARVELSFEAIFEADAVQEIRNRLRHTVVDHVQGHRVRSRSLCYPLAVNNLVSAALNEAVRIGAPKVNGSLIVAAARAL